MTPAIPQSPVPGGETEEPCIRCKQPMDPGEATTFTICSRCWPSSPEVWGERPCLICGQPKERHQGPERFCAMYATYRPASSTPVSAGREENARCTECGAEPNRHTGGCSHRNPECAAAYCCGNAMLPCYCKFRPSPVSSGREDRDTRCTKCGVQPHRLFGDTLRCSSCGDVTAVLTLTPENNWLGALPSPVSSGGVPAIPEWDELEREFMEAAASSSGSIQERHFLHLLRTLHAQALAGGEARRVTDMFRGLPISRKLIAALGLSDDALDADAIEAVESLRDAAETWRALEKWSPEMAGAARRLIESATLLDAVRTSRPTTTTETNDA